MKEIKYVQPTKHPQYLYIRAQTKTICIIQTHTQGPFYPPYKLRGWGAASTSMYVPLAQPATQPQYVYIPAQTEQFVFFKQINKIQHIIQTKLGGGGEQRSPRVSPREALRNPLGGPSEHHRDPHGESYWNPSTPWGTKSPQLGIP